MPGLQRHLERLLYGCGESGGGCGGGVRAGHEPRQGSAGVPSGRGADEFPEGSTSRPVLGCLFGGKQSYKKLNYKSNVRKDGLRMTCRSKARGKGGPIASVVE